MRRLSALIIIGILIFSVFQIVHFASPTSVIIVPDDYPTIQQAINAASDGDTIFVRKGTYYENLVVNKTLSLIGESIDSTIIDGSNVGNVVLIVVNNVNVTGFTIENCGNVSYAGICLDSAYSNIIGNRITANHGDGVGLDQFSYCNVISGNDIGPSKIFGIEVKSDKNTISGNNVTESHGDAGIYLAESSGNIVSGNNITTNWIDGVLLFDSSDDVVSENSITHNGGGVYLSSSSRNIIANNDITADGWAGVEIIESSESNIVSRNRIASNVQGLCISSAYTPAAYNNVSENNVESNSQCGFYLYNSSENMIFHNNVTKNAQGVFIQHSNYANAFDNNYPSGGNYWSDFNCTDMYSGPFQNDSGADGIGDSPYVFDSNNVDNYPLMRPYVSFENQTIYINADGSIDPSGAPILRQGDLYTLTGDITCNGEGIAIERENMALDGVGHTLQGADSQYAIDLIDTSNVAVKNVNIHDFDKGIHLNQSNDNIVTNNTMYNVGDGICLDSSSDYNDITGNAIAWVADSGICLDSSGNNISRNDIEHASEYGIWLAYSCNNSISGNNLTNNYGDGIYLDTCSGNSMIGNDIVANNEFGIEGESCSCNSIDGNYITSNLGDGIWLAYSCNNSISGNDVENNIDGITLVAWGSTGPCNNNSVSGNRVIANSMYGIALQKSSGDRIYHNTFINNSGSQVWDVFPEDDVNVWDNGYPSGGNYWSDYNGTDAYCGPYQNILGSDGIGDSPYFIDSSNTDHYPLMLPFNASMTRSIDLFTQRGGEGANQPDGDFEPLDMVSMYANITDSGTPVSGKLVSFTIRGPANPFANTTLVLTSATKDSGIAQCSFRIPFPDENLEEVLETWFAQATASIDDQIVSDIVTFQVEAIPSASGGAGGRMPCLS